MLMKKANTKNICERLKGTTMNAETQTIKDLMDFKAVFFTLFCLSVFIASDTKSAAGMGTDEQPAPVTVYLVPNTHGTIGGWLTDFSKERNYCLNNYLDHLDYMRNESDYCLAVSEVPHLISMLQFDPDRMKELKQLIKQGRVELVNGFFLEPTINLSGGEALVRMGVEGLRWQKEVMGIKPRFCWMIDVTGIHCQMPQIVSGLGLEGLIFCRNNRAKENIFWWYAPDGSRTLGVCTVHYCPFNWRNFFTSETPLTAAQISEMIEETNDRIAHNPKNASVLMLIGGADYSLSPAYKGQVAELMAQWKKQVPKTELCFNVPGKFLDETLNLANDKKIQLRHFNGDSAYCFDACWISNPKVKKWFRQCEHNLQAAEIAAAIASLSGDYTYPAQPLYHAWLQLLLNMDRNTLWGDAGGMVFESEQSWDAKDRFEAIERTSSEILRGSMRTLIGKGNSPMVFNPLNWRRQDPVMITLPHGSIPADIAYEAMEGGNTLICQWDASVGIVSLKTVSGQIKLPAEVDLPEVIETQYYSIRIDRKTGALTSLKVKPSGREILSGPANVLTVQTPSPEDFNAGDLMVPRAQRRQLASSEDFKPTITVTKGTLSTTVNVASEFYKGSKIRRIMRIYHDHPRIDFDTILENIPDESVQVLVDFPLANDIQTARRGVPYGFSEWQPGRMEPPLEYYQSPYDHIPYGYSDAIFPAVRWSAYDFKDSGGIALLDRGLTGREITGRTISLFLMNALGAYRGYENTWLSGKGENQFSYALVAYDKDWQSNNIPRLAWEFNQPPIIIPGGSADTAKSFLETSDNVIVEAIRREDNFIEIRMVESKGLEGTVRVCIRFPHKDAALTNLIGENQRMLQENDGYKFAVKPQQIITMRLSTDSMVERIEPLRNWEPLIPAGKRKAYNQHLDLKGHPPY